MATEDWPAGGLARGLYGEKGGTMDEHLRNEAAQGNLDPQRNLENPPSEGTPQYQEAPEVHLHYDSQPGESVMAARERYGGFMNEAELYRQTLERLAGMDQTEGPNEP